MIDEQRTLELFGYTSDKWKPQSSKLIVVVCEGCGKYRILPKFNYNDLCRSCAQIGKHSHISGSNHPMWGKHHSDATIKLMSKKQSGKNHHLYGKHRSSETCKRMSEGSKGRIWSKEARIKNSCTSQGISIEDFDGFIGSDRSHVKWEYQCTKLNTKFFKSEAHHITSGVIIYIPKKLHQSIRHNMKNGKNMQEINKLAMNYLINGL